MSSHLLIIIIILIPSFVGFERGLRVRLRLRLRSALAVAIICSTAAFATTTNTPATRAIGIEGNVSLELPRPDYRPRPLDDRTELILRIEAITPAANQLHRYDFYYMGLEPGSYHLADYLVRADGSRPDELGEIQVHVQATLPEDHNGQLTGYTPGRFPFIGGYRIFLGLVGVSWAGGIAAFALSYRKKRVAAAPVVVVVEPSFAERIRPLVEAAAAGKLSVEGEAQLERLLMGFWREKLNLPELRMAETLERLKAHAQAGELLRALEHWLHQRTGASRDEVNALLMPYGQPSQPANVNGGAS